MKIKLVYIALVVCCIIFVYFTSGQHTVHITKIQTYGNEKDAELVQAYDAKEDNQNYLYITDKLEFCVKKYSPKGELIKIFGKYGKNKKEFLSPGALSIYDNSIAIVDEIKSEIMILDKNLNFIRSFKTLGPALDICFDNLGNLYTHCLGADGQSTFLKYDILGNLVKRINSTDFNKKENGVLWNTAFIAINSNNYLIIAYRYINKIEVYNQSSQYLSSFTINNLPKKSIKKFIDKKISIPSDLLIIDVAIDSNDNILLLGGDLSENPNRDLFIYSPKGKFITRTLLPEKTGILTCTPQNKIYTREKKRTTVSKYTYKIVNSN